MCAWVRYSLRREDDVNFTYGLRCPPKHHTQLLDTSIEVPPCPDPDRPPRTPPAPDPRPRVGQYMI